MANKLTEQQELTNLFNRLGIGIEIGQSNSIILRQGNSKVNGYNYFYASFSFDKDGKFVDVEIAE